ncbi:hypothetical protein HWV62_17984 [Athelia sp. TMB]|nr:hypothetical protein HWV62_17984 [Athelia sp. TMB]
MKQILAAIAAAEVDKLIETKGMDHIDRHRARRMAERQAHHLAQHRYQGGTGYQYALAQQGYGFSAPYNYQSSAPWGMQGCPSYGYAPPNGYYPPPQGYAPPAQGYYPPPQGYASYPQGNPYASAYAPEQ